MYKKNGVLLTAYSLRTLPKVWSPTRLNSISKTLPLLLNFSTATERLNYDNSGGFIDEHCVDHKQRGFNGEDMHMNHGPGGKWNVQKNGEHFQQNINGLSGYTGKGQLNEFQQSTVRQNVNFGLGGVENMQQNFSKLPSRHDGNYQDPYNVYPAESYRNKLQQTSVGQSASFGNRNSTDSQKGGYYSGNRVAQQNAVSYNVGDTGHSDQNRENYRAARPGNFNNTQSWPNTNHAGTQQSPVGPVSQDNVDVTGGDEHVLNGIEKLDDFLRVGNVEEAVELLAILEKQGIPIDLPRYLALMKACGENRSLEEAKAIHQHLTRSIPNLELSVYNKILEMYSACGSMTDAFMLFDAMPHNLTSWDIMITGLAKNGLGEAAIDLFSEFKKLGLKPDGQMYLGIFLACTTLHDNAEGMLHYKAMSKDYGIVPSMEHYVGVVDMLASVGCLDEALEFIEKMPMEPTVEIWEKLMNLSRIQGNMELGDHCADLVGLLDPTLLNDQSRAGLLPLKISDLAKEKGKQKEGVQSPLDVKSRMHEYRAGDRSDPDHERLYTLLRRLKEQMKEEGYVPELKVVLHDVDPESKEEALLSHSERLALARGFIGTPARQLVRIVKNLRVCVDCHNASKIISKLVGRELAMRDAKRWHHFKDGVCSCRDYW